MKDCPIDARHQKFIEALKTQMPVKQIYTDLLTRFAYGTDASLYRYVPQVVVRAHNEAEIAQLIRLAKTYRVALTFRASGTSLSGQACSESVLVLMGDGFFKLNIVDDGHVITLGPMVIGASANKALKPYGRKIGPDPASINTARIGGILANNSSGMCCGTKDNSYYTLMELRMMLADGTILDTHSLQSVADFRVSHANFLKELTVLSARIKDDSALRDKVRHKYRLKNTTGYGVNALIDFDDPIEMLKHLMVGSEGTLGFVSEVTYRTVPEYDHRASAFIFFNGLHDCCEAAAALKHGAIVDAVELLDGRSIQLVGETITGLHEFFYRSSIKAEACLLIETTAVDATTLMAQIAVINDIVAVHHVVAHTEFQTDPLITKQYWDVRKGLLPIIAKGRPSGASVIIEDVVFPMEHLVAGVEKLTQLFEKYSYPEAMIMGHALEGNLHFILTPLMDSATEVVKFDRFLQEMTDVVALELGGALKGEHGTGRNIAPFVCKEWGEEIYGVMCALKTLFDPELILNPDVIISGKATIHIDAVKSLPTTDDTIDACMECGFCEPACASDGLSLTPRQRISVYRNMQTMVGLDRESTLHAELTAAFDYQGIQTCAQTGMCAPRCPVGINTGAFIKSLSTKAPSRLSAFAANNFALVEQGVRVGLHMSQWVGPKNRAGLSRKLHGVVKRIPIIPETMPKVATKLPASEPVFSSDGQVPVVYFVSCVNRTIGEISTMRTTTAMHTLNLFKKAGYTPILCDPTAGLCCGQPFDSMNDEVSGAQQLAKLNQTLLQASNNGVVPIYIDNAPCALRVLEAKAGGTMDARLQIYDATSFLLTNVLPKLTLNKVPQLMLHTPCSTAKVQHGEQLVALALACTDKLLQTNIDCCGFAGTKGFTVPELNANSLRKVADRIPEECVCGVSTSKTCQIGLSAHTGINFQSIEALLDQCSP